MKPHPKLRKTIKWGGAAVTVLLVGVWAASGQWDFGWTWASGHFVLASSGIIGVGNTGDLPRGRTQSPGWFANRSRIGFQWWIADQRGQGGYWAFGLPLVWPAAATALAAAIAWRRDALARRIARLNLCQKCTYDRTGIAADAACPECGDIPKIV